MARTGFRHALLPAAALAIASVAGCGILPPAACAGGGAPPGGGAADGTVIRVAAVPAADSAGFFVALHKGLFAARGLTIRYTPALSSDTVIDAQVKGEYDITAGNYVSYVEHVVDQGQPLEIVAEGSVMQRGSQALYTMPGSPVTTLAQLRGRVIGTNAPRNINYLLAASVLTEAGVSPSSVRFTTSPVAFPDLIAALREHKVDAVALPEPFATMAQESLGASELADLDQGATWDFPVLGYVATKGWAQAHPAALRAFLSALAQGQQDAEASRGDVEQAMEALAGISPGVADLMALDSYPVGLDKARLQRVPDVMWQFGILKARFDIGRMLPAGT